MNHQKLYNLLHTLCADKRTFNKRVTLPHKYEKFYLEDLPKHLDNNTNREFFNAVRHTQKPDELTPPPYFGIPLRGQEIEILNEINKSPDKDLLLKQFYDLDNQCRTKRLKDEESIKQACKTYYENDVISKLNPSAQVAIFKVIGQMNNSDISSRKRPTTTIPVAESTRARQKTLKSILKPTKHIIQTLPIEEEPDPGKFTKYDFDVAKYTDYNNDKDNMGSPNLEKKLRVASQRALDKETWANTWNQPGMETEKAKVINQIKAFNRNYPPVTNAKAKKLRFHEKINQFLEDEIKFNPEDKLRRPHYQVGKQNGEIYVRYPKTANNSLEEEPANPIIQLNEVQKAKFNNYPTKKTNPRKTPIVGGKTKQKRSKQKTFYPRLGYRR